MITRTLLEIYIYIISQDDGEYNWILTAARPTGGLITRGAVWFCIHVAPVSTGRKDSLYQQQEEMSMRVVGIN